MLFLLTPSSIRNRDYLNGVRVPKQVLGRGFDIRPRGGLKNPVFWRLLIEQALTRYLIALSPFPVALAIWPDLALPISQAPVLMFGIVLYIESNVLSVPTPDRRRALMDASEIARGLDHLRARARSLLTRVAARRGLTGGVLHLVVEQSAMARVRPFTILSLQYEGATVQVLDLDPEEARLLQDTLFDAELPERHLHRINLAENIFLRDMPLDARSVSAHARLAALAERRPLTAQG